MRGASGLARAIGLSPLVIGLTVVSMATSAPELAVSLDAALVGSPGLAVGNVVGSNIANVLLILGVSALVLPMRATSRLVRADVPVMIGLSALALVLALDGRLSTIDGVVLFALLVGYVWWSVVSSRRETRDNGSGGERPSPRRAGVDALLCAVGVGLLVLGARWLVAGAVDIAAALGVGDLVIGLTVVAIGTSLPELATSVVAAVRGERDLAIGNVVGSNVFNLGSVLGLTAVIGPDGVPVEAGALAFDLPVMVAVAVALLPVAFTGGGVGRWEGLLFLVYYAAYLLYLVLDGTDHAALPLFSGAMLAFVVPLTVLTLAVLVGVELRQREAARDPAPPG